MSKLESFLGKQIALADKEDTTREKLLDRYLGEPYGDEVAGRSEVVTSEVFDVVEAITAEMMDVLTSADRIATFRPKNQDDEERAEAETDACNAIFWERNPGFENLQTWVKSGLIEQVGYVRSGWAQKRDVSIEEFKDVPPEAVQMFLGQMEVDPEVDTAELMEVTQDDAGLASFRAKVVRQRFVYEIEPLPQDQVLVTPRWRKQSLQDCPFVAIKDDTKTKSELIAMGFARDDVEELCKGSGEDDARFETRDLDEQKDTSKITIYECYVLWDQDDDGIDERLKCWCASSKGKLLHWSDGSEAVEETDGVPVYSWTPILVPHRHAGRSASEITDDIQRQNTVLMRSLFDSIYATIYPRPVVNTEVATPDTWSDLARPDHGAPIRVKGENAIAWNKPPAIIGDILPALQRMDAIKEERTGVTKLAQGLDKNALTDTASGQAALMSQAMKRIKLIARNMAEYGLKDLFVGMHRDLRKGNWKTIPFKREHGWQEEQPIQWPPRTDMAVSIGTGNGDRAEKRQTLTLAMQAQEKLIMGGSLMVDEARIYEAIDRFVRLGGFPSASPFFLDPRSPEYAQKAQQKAQQPKEPSPEMLLAQAENTKAQAEVINAQTRQAEVTQKGQIEIANLQAGEARAQREHDEKMQKLALDIEQARMKVAEASRVQSREDRKVDLQEADMILDENFRRDEMAVDARQAQAALQQREQQADRQERTGFFSRMLGGRK